MEERKRESLRTPWRPKYFIPEVILFCYQVLGPAKIASTFIVETVGQTLGPHRPRVEQDKCGSGSGWGWNLGSSFPSEVLVSHTILRAGVYS